MFWIGLIIGFAVGGAAGYYFGRNRSTLSQTKF